jgi:hypothetical protein
MPSPLSLPLHTLRLLGTCGLGLLAWCSAGQAARFALLLLGTEISHGEWRQVRLVLTMFIFTLIVASALIVTVGMLHTLRGALTEIRTRRAEEIGDERYLVALDRVAPAFAVIYLTWGFYSQDAIDFYNLDFTHNVDDLFSAAFTSEQATVGRGLIDLDIGVSVGILIVAWMVKLIFGRRYDNGQGRFSGAIAAFAELSFALYGLSATLVLAGERSDWMSHRSVVAGTRDLILQAEEKIPGWSAFWSAAGQAWPHIVDGVILPLTWLAVAILVFGADVNDTRAAIRGTRMERAAARLDQTHSLTRQSLAKLTGGLQERWIPIFHAIRLTVRGGASLFGIFCLCYVLLELAAAYGEMGVRHLIGPGEQWSALMIGPPVEMIIKILLTVLTMCLLAATFDLASTRARALGRDDAE